MRGALAACIASPKTLGLIPARAGSTRHHLDPTGLGWAHPRPCGEHSAIFFATYPAGGSSPPVRGAPLVTPRPSALRRLIPARAGSTFLVACRAHEPRAHPRPCGEHRPASTTKWADEGSSPPVRGALTQSTCLRAATGLIPARAGSTTRNIYWQVEPRAHPRPCGEHSAKVTFSQLN